MSVLIQAFLGALVVSILSLIGIFSLLINKKVLHSILIILVGFAAGGLMGGAFFHILPEALETQESSFVFALVLLGFCFFFLLERVIHWRHCHHGVCDTHPVAYLNLFGDSLHNFVDGLVIIASFSVDVHLGVITTFSIILHEIPQELGDFGVLLHGGFSIKRALFYNFITACTALLGVIAGYFLLQSIEFITPHLLSFAAGGFIYIAGSDLIPELHKEKSMNKSMLSFIFFFLGVTLMWASKLLFE